MGSYPILMVRMHYPYLLQGIIIYLSIQFGLVVLQHFAFHNFFHLVGASILFLVFGPVILFVLISWLGWTFTSIICTSLRRILFNDRSYTNMTSILGFYCTSIICYCWGSSSLFLSFWRRLPSSSPVALTEAPWYWEEILVSDKAYAKNSS